MSLMLDEARSAPEIIRSQLRRNAPMMADLAEQLRQSPPVSAVTVARGSSDHAASYFAYLCMKQNGIPVASLPPSLTTLAKAPWRTNGHLVIAVSQSGQSLIWLLPSRR